jgi:hypothetical protein
MTVSAPNLALRNLVGDGLPGRTGCDQLSYVSGLVAEVIEPQDNKVRLAAFHTRVILQKLDESTL